VTETDYACIVMVGEKVNFPEVIFFYWLKAFKEKFHSEDKKNHVPYGMLFAQIMRNNGINVFVLEPSAGATQLKVLTFTKWK